MATHDEARGSDKVLEQLFGTATVSSEQLSAAIRQSQVGALRFWRLWWKGQPHPDLIRAAATVDPADFATTVSDLLRLHNEASQLSFEVFPKGVVQLEAVDLHITVNRTPRG